MHTSLSITTQICVTTILNMHCILHVCFMSEITILVFLSVAKLCTLHCLSPLRICMTTIYILYIYPLCLKWSVCIKGFETKSREIWNLTCDCQPVLPARSDVLQITMNMTRQMMIIYILYVWNEVFVSKNLRQKAERFETLLVTVSLSSLSLPNLMFCRCTMNVIKWTPDRGRIHAWQWLCPGPSQLRCTVRCLYDSSVHLFKSHSNGYVGSTRRAFWFYQGESVFGEVLAVFDFLLYPLRGERFLPPALDEKQREVWPENPSFYLESCPIRLQHDGVFHCRVETPILLLCLRMGKEHLWFHHQSRKTRALVFSLLSLQISWTCWHLFYCAAKAKVDFSALVSSYYRFHLLLLFICIHRSH